MFIGLPITQLQCNFSPEIELAKQLKWGTHHATLNNLKSLMMKYEDQQGIV